MKSNKKTIIILSIIIALIIIGIVAIGIMFFNRKGKITTATVKTDPITDSTSLVVEKNGNTIPFSDDSLTGTSSENNTNEATEININPITGEPETTENNDDLYQNELNSSNETTSNPSSTNSNSPEVTGVLKPVVDFKPIDVETSEEDQNNVVLSIDKPTYILFVDLTQTVSAQMLFTINELSHIYENEVDFVVISNFSAGKNEVINYLAENNINLPLYFDNGTLTSPINQYHLTTLPHSFIIDKSGNIVNSYSGFRSSDMISANLDIISENFE